MTRIGRMVRAAGAGALTTYFFDPEEGRRRRALVVDQVTRLLALGRDELRMGTRDTATRAQGAVGEPRGALEGAWPAGDAKGLPPAARLAIPAIAAAAVSLLPRLLRPRTALRLASLAALGAAVGTTERSRERKPAGSARADIDSARLDEQGPLR